MNAIYEDENLLKDDTDSTIFDVIQDLITTNEPRAAHQANYYSEADLVSLVALGFPTSAYETVADWLHLPKNAIGAETTIRNRIRNEKTLNSEESERVIRLLRVFTTAKNLYGSSKKAVEWMHKPRRFIPGKEAITPIELSALDVGARLVEEQLLRTTYGVY
ncbi:hypothetical protein [Xanthomonas oryzae]|uniref:hypothetical protein n=1 Tax=Xanthomonas oryzae TaxID=347 RepID=UPI0011F2C69C|nr:hypothetical protein [Xanthomonas oryzae]QEO96922.1 hypothetical protein XOCgx_1930 [Xanthomonas oryzae pv. oryzicola]UBB94424.1 hypothetical protein K2I41_08740 [Xanthomonas oryzae pv. oryzicola]WGY42394.1 hypothetical protein HED68_08435 [Xanthomonas oryzae pv. oryzicola]